MHINFFHNNLIEELCFGSLSSLCRSTRLRSLTIIVTHGKGITQTIALSLGISKVKTINIETSKRLHYNNMAVWFVSVYFKRADDIAIALSNTNLSTRSANKCFSVGRMLQ